MRLIVLPGMDGGSGLSAEFRAQLATLSVAAEYPPDEPLGYGQLEGLVRDLLGRGEAPSVLLAESFSGPLAIRIAASPPPGLVAVILVATFASPPVAGWLRHLAGSYAFRISPPRSMVRRFMLDAEAPESAVDDVLAAVRTVHPAVLAHRVREALSVDVRDELARIRLPAMAIEGTRDRLVRARRGVAALRADLERRLVDAPHLVLKSAPRQSADVVEEFLRTC